MRKRILTLTLIALFVGIAALVAYQFFFIRMVRDPTSAMANTILPGDRLVVKRLFGDIKRGDIVMFKYRNEGSEQYLARVVGLPREKIEIRDKFVMINGTELPERRVMVELKIDIPVLPELSSEGSGPYQVYYSFPRGIERAMPPNAGMTFGIKEPYQIPEHHYFVMGDNRDNSYDSRFQGTVPRELIWGKATVIYWSSYGDRSHEEKIRWERINTKVR